MAKKHKDKSAKAGLRPAPAGEDRKRFTVYVDCEHEDFQGTKFAITTGRLLMRVIGKIAEGKLSGPISMGETTIGQWKTHWRNDDPADRRPKRSRSKPTATTT
jgi:hypothetical protein